MKQLSTHLELQKFIALLVLTLQIVRSHDHAKTGCAQTIVENGQEYCSAPASSPPHPYASLLDRFDTKQSAYISTLVISVIPTGFLVLFPSSWMQIDKEGVFLKFSTGLAVGCLLGDSFIHIIPHALEEERSAHSHGDSHNHGHHHHSFSKIPQIIVSGIIAFFAIESIISILTSEKSAKSNKQQKSSGCHSPRNSCLLNLVADFSHNFVDGLAIGNAFLVDKNAGIATVFTIFMHEIPHEISDFAILVNFGCSKWKAIAFQLFTAAGAFIGTYAGLHSTEFLKFTFNLTINPSYLLCFTAGGFIYIACVCLLSEMVKRSKGICSILVQISGIAAGLYAMAFIEN